MQFLDFLHKKGIPNRKLFVSHRLQIRFFDEGIIFKYTCCAKKDNTKVFLQYSETDLGLSQNLRWSALR